MLITSTIISVLQLAAMTAAVVASLQVNRKQTLSKNFEWVISNPQFARRYSDPPLWPLFIAAFIVVAAVLYVTLTASGTVLLWTKTGGIFGAMAVLVPLYYFLEKKIGDQIPLRENRSASFEKRRVSHYVPRQQLWFANSTTIAALSAFAVLLIADKISVGMCITYLINGIILYGILYGSMLLAVNEKTPHHIDTAIVTKEHVSENYRIFSVRLMTIVIMFISALMLTIAGFMWYGYILADSPFQLDMILSFLSIPLFLYIARCKAIRDIVTVKIIKG